MVMKIVHIINSLQVGGAEKLIAAISRSQAKMGHSVIIVSVIDKIEVAVDDSITVINLKKTKYDFTAILELKRLARDADVVHAHLAPAQYISAFTGLDRLIITEHNTYNRRWNYVFFRLLDRFIYNRCKSVVCISNGVSQRLSMMGVNSKKKKVILNGIDVKEIHAKALAEFSLPEKILKKPIIGMVSRFTEQKNYREAVQLALKMPDFSFVFVGDGETKLNIVKEAQQLQLDNVFFTGNLDNPYSVMKLFSIGLQLSHWEGFGIAAIEMMALGIPVIMSNVPGLNELNQMEPKLDYYNNSEDASKYIRNVFSNKERFSFFQSRARNIANIFSVDKTAQQYLALYKET